MGGVGNAVGVGVGVVMMVVRGVGGVVELVEVVRGGAGVAVVERLNPLPALATTPVPELEAGTGIE